MKPSMLIFLCLLFFCANKVSASTTYVNSQQSFDNAHNSAAANDTIIWLSGTYANIFMEIEKDDLVIKAESLGTVIFNGFSRANINGDRIHFEGFQYVDGSINNNDIVNIRGNHINFTQINMRANSCYKYLRVRESSQFVDISYCNFENRINAEDQNILSILVDDTTPGYHKIRHCSFKNFPGGGNDEGVEPIRIGLSSQADHISRALVEYCYFTQCSGDGEIISSKASQVVYRYNTFEDNPKSELVLRHGSEAIVYSNFFLNGKGGVRVREGQNHYIYNNYFYELDDRAIYLQNEDSDPLDNINIAFNTIVDCSEVILGAEGPDKPSNVTFANNIFANPDDRLFEDFTGTETWIGNLAFGELGLIQPASGMTIGDPAFVENNAGFFELSESSAAIDAAVSGYKSLPDFEGLEDIDMDVLFDIIGSARPADIGMKDLGCSEFPYPNPIQPIATEDNTGPHYNTSIISSTQNPSERVFDLIAISPNPTVDHLAIAVNSTVNSALRIDILDLHGKVWRHCMNQSAFSGALILNEDLSNLPAGTYTIRAYSQSVDQSKSRIQIEQFVKQ